MFYSHEVLTSRKHGVATIWLVATLGQNSTLRKVGRKAIQNVEVDKACDLIMEPDAPMALRLQSALLYGLSRVYSQQCNYVLHDAESMYHGLRHAVIFRSAHLDADTRANPKDLMLPESTNITSDFSIPSIDLDNFLFNRDTSIQFSVASRQSGSSVQHAPLLVIPSDSSFGGYDDMLMSIPRNDHPSSMIPGADDIVQDVDFEIDDEGNIVDKPKTVAATSTPRVQRGTSKFGSDTNAQIRRDHQLGSDDIVRLHDVDFDLPGVGPGMNLENQDTSSLSTAQTLDSTFLLSHESEEAIFARLQRAPKVRKPLPFDRSIQLSRDRRQNENTYVKIMTANIKKHLLQRIPREAKKNAEYFVFGKGLNGIGHNASPHIEHPLSMFSGERLQNWVLGKVVPRGVKRGADESDSSESRRVRHREDNYNPTSFDDFEAHLRMDDDVEVGRRAASDLEDVSSMMPWNISASRRASSLSRNQLPSSALRRSRLVSASPLQSRGATLALLEEAAAQGFSDFDDPFPVTDSNDPAPTDRSQVQKIEAILEKDCNDFLWFIEEGIVNKTAETERISNQSNIEPSKVNYIAFNELIPSEVHTTKTAALGFLMILSLATKNLVRTTQSNNFGEIRISPSAIS